MSRTVTVRIGHNGITRDIEYTAPDDQPTFWGANYDFSVIGEKKIPRPDAIQKVTGKAKYTHDINRPNMLQAVMATCPYANASITNIDTSVAEGMPGVKAVMTPRSVRTARSAGWLIACVAAETIQQARDAARKIKVDYEPQSFDFEPEGSGTAAARFALSSADDKATQAEATKEGRVSLPVQLDRGDVEAGLAQSTVTHEAVYETQVTPHCCLETHGCVAEFEGENLTVWYSTQGIWNVRSSCASAGRLSSSQTRIITQHMGGGFGSKLQAEEFCGLCIQMAKETGRPVKLMANRYEDIVMCGNKPGAIMSVRIGATNDGDIRSVGVDAQAIVGYTGSSGIGGPFYDNYDIPSVSVQESTIRLNAGAPRPFRAPGRPQGAFGLEMAIEELAFKLKIDPFELRLKNVSSDELDARVHEMNVGAERFGWKEKYRPHGSDGGTVRPICSSFA